MCARYKSDPVLASSFSSSFSVLTRCSFFFFLTRLLPVTVPVRQEETAQRCIAPTALSHTPSCFKRHPSFSLQSFPHTCVRYICSNYSQYRSQFTNCCVTDDMTKQFSAVVSSITDVNKRMVRAIKLYNGKCKNNNPTVWLSCIIKLQYKLK